MLKSAVLNNKTIITLGVTASLTGAFMLLTGRKPLKSLSVVDLVSSIHQLPNSAIRIKDSGIQEMTLKKETKSFLKTLSGHVTLGSSLQ